MNQIITQKQQHMLETTQASREPVKKVSKLLQKNQYTIEDLMGLSWVLFEREIIENDPKITVSRCPNYILSHIKQDCTVSKKSSKKKTKRG